MNETKSKSNKFQSLKVFFALFVLSLSLVQSVHAQDVEEVRWKSESHVRNLYGEPNSVRGPVGTHASYQLWTYDNFTVAFANNRAFHLFNNNRSNEFELEENRSSDSSYNY